MRGSHRARTRPPATIASPMNTGARNCAEMASTAPAPPAHAEIARREVAHREHPVRDDPGEPRRPCERLVLVQRVLVAARIRIGLHVLGRHDAGERGKLLPDRTSSHRRHQSAARSIIVDRAVQTTSPPASSTRSIAIDEEAVPAAAPGSTRAGIGPRASRPRGAAAERVLLRSRARTREKSRSSCRVGDDLRERGELRRRDEGRRNALADPEQRPEGGDPLRVDDERRCRVGRSFGGGIHRASRSSCTRRPSDWGTAENRRLSLHVSPHTTGLRSADGPHQTGTATLLAWPIPSPSSSPTTTARSARRCRSRSTRNDDLTVIEVVDRRRVPPMRVDAMTEQPDVRADGSADAGRRRDRGDAADPATSRSAQRRDHPVRAGRRRGPSPARSRPARGGSCARRRPWSDLAEAIRRAYRGEPLHAAAEVEPSLARSPRAAARSRRRARSSASSGSRRASSRSSSAMADGRRPSEIANELGMSRHTLRTHTQNVLTKLGVHSKTDAVVAAIRFGKVTPRCLAVDGS